MKTTLLCASMSIVMLCACGSDADRFRTPTQPPASTVAPPSASWGVSGLVVDDATGQPVAKATVEWAGLIEAWGDRGDGVLTDASGKYRMAIAQGGPGAAERRIVMRASKQSEGEDTQEVTLAVSGDTTVNFRLKPAAR